MKKKSRTLAILLTGLALSIGVAVSSGIIRNSYVADEVKAATSTIVLNNIGAGLGATANTTVATTTVNSYVLNYLQAKKQASGTSYAMFLTKSVGAFVSNKTAIPGPISSIKVSILSGAAGATTYRCSFDTAEFLSAGTTGTPVNITGGNSNTYTNDVSGATYFCISLGNANNGQVLSLEIVYESAPAKALTSLVATGTVSNSPFYDGQSFDPTGLTITAYYDDESSAVVTNSCTFLPNPLTAGVTSVTASYKEEAITVTTAISGFTVVTRTVSSISVITNPSKMFYIIGQSFDPAGMKIRATYDMGPTNDDYLAYSYSPTAAFDSLGEKTITITSTENASAVTTLAVNVQEIAEGTYTITSNTETYTSSPTLANLTIAKSDSNMQPLSLSATTNFRLGATASGDSSVKTKMLFGGAQDAPGTATFTLPEGLYATSVKLTGITRSTDTNTPVPTLSINGVLKYTYSASVTELTTKVYANSLVISSSNKRLWVGSIEITTKSVDNAALDYGTHFLAQTAAECSTLNVSQATWNSLDSVYSNADLSVKNIIKAATANQSGNDLEKAIARYTYIATKYGYLDYMSLGIVSGSNQYVNNDANSNITLIIVVSILGLSTLVGYKLLTKKKDID